MSETKHSGNGSNHRDNRSGGSAEPSEIESAVRQRIGEKLGDYAKYNLSSREACLLNILFDLMQEYQEEEYLNLLPVLLLDMVFGLPAELYSRESDGISGTDGHFKLCTPALRPLSSGADAPQPANSSPDWDDWLEKTDFRRPLKLRGNILLGERVCIPVRGRYVSKSQEEQDREVRGLLVLYPPRPFTDHELLFLEKFANRLGFAMHNNALARRNREHLEFVRNLVKDIGHNVLGPNMYFKLLINKLASSLLSLGGRLGTCRAEADDLEKLKEAHLDILDQINEIQQNFNHSSLFLESLLRESHFIQGCYVLRPCRVNIYERVLKAQFKSHLPLFKAKGIKAELLAPPTRSQAPCEADPETESAAGPADRSGPKDAAGSEARPPAGLAKADLEAADPDASDGGEFETDADFGLISQVAANIFSNALKYASIDPAWPTGSAENGRCPFVRCGVEYDEQGRIRVYVLSSGKRIKPEEVERLFDKYYRASNSGNISGTGKGLHFVRDIVARHGGQVGYQATEEGNKFYFSLPCAATEA